MSQPARVITIVCGGAGSCALFEGERYHDHLCWEEMLAQVIQLTHPQLGTPRYLMLTPEEHRERDERFIRDTAQPVADEAAQLAEHAGDTEAAILERAAASRAERGYRGD